MAFVTFTTGRIKAAEVNGNFALCVRTDSAKTISVTHTWTATQTFSGGLTTTTITTSGVTIVGGASDGSAYAFKVIGDGTGDRFRVRSNAAGNGVVLIASNAAEDNTASLAISATSTTFTGVVITGASATGGAGFRLPHGSAPSAPVNGDVWTTTAGLFVRINGATVGPLS